MNKIINSRCVCNICLSWTSKKQIMILPCEHIIHESCHKNDKICEICNSKIVKIMTFDDIKKESNKGIIQYQRYIDMITSSNVDDMLKIDKYDPVHLSNIISFIGTLPLMKGYDECQKACQDILKFMNTKLIIRGMEHINDKPKVYISTHTTHLDWIVISSIINTSYMAGAFIGKSFFGKIIMDIIPLLIIDRNKKNASTVQEMGKHIKTHGSLCLFPEGTVTHPDIIQRFRTGAFYTGYPVQPIVIRYDKMIYDNDVTKYVKKISTTKDLTVSVDILPSELPPFDDKRIEEIRHKMAKTGNLAVSRVSNRDLIELKTAEVEIN